MSISITEVVKRKWIDETVADDATRKQNLILNKLNSCQLTYIVNKEKLDFLDYTSDIAKRRSQTVGLAYTIGFRFLVALLKSKTKREAVLNHPLFMPATFEHAKEQLRQYPYADIFNIYEQALLQISTMLDCTDWCELTPRVFDCVANVSTTFAWFESYRRSGYFPADLTIMLKDSEVHKALVTELTALFNRSTDILNDIGLMSACYYPTLNIADLDLNQEFDIAVTDEEQGINFILEISTTAKPDQYIQDNLRKFGYLNLLLDGHTIPCLAAMPSVVMFFPRYNYSVSPIVVTKTNE